MFHCQIPRNFTRRENIVAVSVSAISFSEVPFGREAEILQIAFWI